MGLSNKTRKSLPVAKRNGNEYKLGQEMLAYKTGRSVTTIQDECAEYEQWCEIESWLRVTGQEFEYEYDWEGYAPGADESYDPWDTVEYEDELPFLQLQYTLQTAVVCRSPFAQLSSEFAPVEQEDPAIELTRKIQWYSPDTSSSFNCDLLVERLQRYFRKDLPGALEAAESRLEGVRSQWQQQELLVLVALFRPFWIRQPGTWSGGTQESLLRHLFVRYDVPAFLYREWGYSYPVLNGRSVWNLWFIMIGQGVKLGRVFPNLGKKYDQCLFQLPADLPECTDGYYDRSRVYAMAAEARRIGASDATVLRLARTRAFRQSPLEMTPVFHEFFEGTVKWLEAHGQQLHEDQADSVLAWAFHLHTERLRDLQQQLQGAGTAEERAVALRNVVHFSWRGRTAASASAAAQRHERQLLAIRQAQISARANAAARVTWSNKGLDLVMDHGEDSWSIEELCSLKELIEEGGALSHCVALYSSSCIAGQSAIFSLRRNGQRKITIELHCSSGRVVQARGMANRATQPIEDEIIQGWRRQCIDSEVA